MLAQIDSVEIVGKIWEKPEPDACVHKVNSSASFTDYRSEWCIEHWGRYFKKAGSEEIDIETDASDSEYRVQNK